MKTIISEHFCYYQDYYAIKENENNYLGTLMLLSRLLSKQTIRNKYAIREKKNPNNFLKIIGSFQKTKI